MPYERFIEIHGHKYFQSDIENMKREEIYAVCSFLDNEIDLRWVQNHCNENLKFIVDNILFKL